VGFYLWWFWVDIGLKGQNNVLVGIFVQKSMLGDDLENSPENRAFYHYLRMM
jgi:hypothetical protein